MLGVLDGDIDLDAPKVGSTGGLEHRNGGKRDVVDSLKVLSILSEGGGQLLEDLLVGEGVLVGDDYQVDVTPGHA